MMPYGLKPVNTTWPEGDIVHRTSSGRSGLSWSLARAWVARLDGRAISKGLSSLIRMTGAGARLRSHVTGFVTRRTPIVGTFPDQSAQHIERIPSLESNGIWLAILLHHFRSAHYASILSYSFLTTSLLVKITITGAPTSSLPFNSGVQVHYLNITNILFVSWRNLSNVVAFMRNMGIVCMFSYFHFPFME